MSARACAPAQAPFITDNEVTDCIKQISVMAQPSHSFPPRVYTPAQSPYANPPAPYLPPPTKRVRLSPNAQSPQSSPTNQHSALPNQVFSSPYAPISQTPTFSVRDFEPPQAPIPGPSATGIPYQVGAMGPPSRPPVDKDKPTDMSDLSDVLAGSGIDLKAEEAALVTRMNYEQQGGSSIASYPSVYTPSLNGAAVNQYYGNRVQGDLLSRNIPGDKSSFYGAGTFNQQSVPYQEGVDEERIRKRALRIQAEREQHHLNNPFLLPANISKKLLKQASTTQTRVNNDGHYKANAPPASPYQVYASGPDQHEVLTVLKGQDSLAHSSSLTQVLTLISLACKERLRLVIEDSATLAQGRRTGAHGIVPADLADIAIGDGSAKPTTVIPNAAETAGHSKASPPNGDTAYHYSFSSFTDKNIGLADPSMPKSTTSDNASKTIQFPNALAPYYQESVKKNLSAEERRAAKRQKRANNEISPTDASRANSISGPGLLANGVSEIDTKKLPSKKESKRQETAKATEAQQHAATQQTMKMQLGGRSAQRSWMTNSAKPALGMGFPVQNRKPPLGGQARPATGPGGTGAQAGKRKAADDFREDGEMGLKIQLRDILLSLEGDVKEGKALARAYRKLDSRGGPKSDANVNGS